MVNKHSSDGIAEDMIRSIVQLGCAELHAKTLYEKAVGELEEGLIDVKDPDILSGQLTKIDLLIEDIEQLAQTRRRVMLKLYDMYEGDKDFWCQIKHLGTAAYTLFEAYEASEDDRELLDMAMNANKAFLRALSRFLGVEITECAACFADALKAREVE